MNTTTTDFDFEWRDLTLAGTLHTPADVDASPLVVMMQGSGPADRDCDGYFDPIRARFLEVGLAVYSFDKAGCGESTGDWRNHDLSTRAEQVETALDLLATHPAIDERRMGVWGQSQGGWMAQILASRRAGLAFAIANSGPSIPVVEQDLYGTEHQFRSHGMAEEDIERALDLMRRLHRSVFDGAGFDAVRTTILEEAKGRPWADYLELEDEMDLEIGRLLLVEDYQPLDALRTVGCPFLAIYGGHDVLLPAWRCAEESGRALDEAPADDVTVTVFPSGNHRIRNDETGEFVPGYLDLLGDWTTARLAR